MTERGAFPAFSKSAQYVSRYPEVAFGLTLISGCRNHPNPYGFDQYKRKVLRKMRRRETLAEIRGRIATYDRFFESFGYPCPLPRHLERTVHSGFYRYNLLVDTHFMAEMCAGILVAVTDMDRFDGALTLDLADAGETCQGMGERILALKQGEIVLRDEKDIVCVLCQGADEKTRVAEETSNVLYYAYAVPGIPKAAIETGLTLAAETVRDFGEGTTQGVWVY